MNRDARHRLEDAIIAYGDASINTALTDDARWEQAKEAAVEAWLRVETLLDEMEPRKEPRP